MDEYFVLKRPSYYFVYIPAKRVGEFHSNRAKSSEIHVKGELEFVWESKTSGALALFFIGNTPKIYNPKMHTISKVRDMKQHHCQIAGDLLINSENGITEVWLNKGSEYQHLENSEHYFYSGSYTICEGANGEKILRTSNRSIPIVPEDMICVYPKPDIEDILSEHPATTDLVTLYKQRHDFPLEAIIQKSRKFKNSLVVSPGNIYAIRFNRSSNNMRYWYGKQGSMKLARISQGHACTIYAVCFLGKDEFFTSLDSVGTLKIWKLDNEVIECCQTMPTEDFDRSEEYLNLSYDPNMHMLRMEFSGGYDLYALRLDTYKRKQKNTLIRYLKTEFKPQERTVLVSNKAAAAVSSSPNNELKPVVKRALKPTISAGYDLCQISIDRQSNQDAESKSAGSRFKKGSIEISVGIDFGTSRTKICYRTAVDETAKIMHFHSMRKQYYEHEYEDWTIPSMVASFHGKFLFGYEALLAKTKSKHIKLKTSLLSNTVNDQDIIICAAYLAFLFDQTEELIKAEAHIVSNYRFTYSVCLPVEKMNDNKIVENMHLVLKLAETINDKKCYHNPQEVSDQLAEMRSMGTAIKRDYSQVIAESAAEIADFHNRAKEPGLYALFDFGAGTTDMTVFKLKTREQKKADMIGAKIIYKGFSDIEAKIKEADDSDSIVRQHYMGIFNDFQKSGILKEVKSKLSGPESMKPVYEMRILASGGGSLHKTVLDVFSKPMLYDDDGSHGAKKIQVLTNPPRWLSDEAPYYRCAVAYGLSGDPKKLKDNYILPKDCKVEVFEQKKRELSEEEILYNQRRFHRG